MRLVITCGRTILIGLALALPATGTGLAQGGVPDPMAPLANPMLAPTAPVANPMVPAPAAPTTAMPTPAMPNPMPPAGTLPNPMLQTPAPQESEYALREDLGNLPDTPGAA